LEKQRDFENRYNNRNSNCNDYHCRIFRKCWHQGAHSTFRVTANEKDVAGRGRRRLIRPPQVNIHEGRSSQLRAPRSQGRIVVEETFATKKWLVREESWWREENVVKRHISVMMSTPLSHPPVKVSYVCVCTNWKQATAILDDEYVYNNI